MSYTASAQAGISHTGNALMVTQQQSQDSNHTGIVVKHKSSVEGLDSMEIQLMKCVKKGRVPIIEPIPCFSIVDNCFFDEINRHWWGLTKDGYARRKERKNNKTLNYSIHSEVMRIAGIQKPGEDFSIDHINGNKLDNRLENLRWATRQQQGFNTIQHRDLPRGVLQRGSKFVAQITSRTLGIHEYLGSFDTPQEASEKFNQRFSQLFPDAINYRRK